MVRQVDEGVAETDVRFEANGNGWKSGNEIGEPDLAAFRVLGAGQERVAREADDALDRGEAFAGRAVEVLSFDRIGAGIFEVEVVAAAAVEDRDRVGAGAAAQTGSGRISGAERGTQRIDGIAAQGLRDGFPFVVGGLRMDDGVDGPAELPAIVDVSHAHEAYVAGPEVVDVMGDRLDRASAERAARLGVGAEADEIVDESRGTRDGEELVALPVKLH